MDKCPTIEIYQAIPRVSSRSGHTTDKSSRTGNIPSPLVHSTPHLVSTLKYSIPTPNLPHCVGNISSLHLGLGSVGKREPSCCDQPRIRWPVVIKDQPSCSNLQLTSKMPFTPIQTLVGASMLGISAYHVLVLNGGVLGVSGFAHRTTSWVLFESRKYTRKPVPKGDVSDDVSPDPDHLAALSIGGLLAGGLVLGFFHSSLETQLQTQLVDIYRATSMTEAQAAGLVLAGMLVGVGSKLSNGCTSGHMLCGVSRLAPRSLAATMTFFPVSVLTHLLLGRLSTFSLDLIPEQPVGLPAWQLVLLLQLPVLAYRYGAAFFNGLVGERYARQIVSFATSFHFALGLTVSGMLRPSKVLNFLRLTPISVKNSTWDPSLAMIILAGILPQVIIWKIFLGSHVRRADTRPAFANKWSVPMPGPEWWKGIDARLIIGAALFGVGWGMCGICPGPATVLLGAAMTGEMQSQLWKRVGLWAVGFVSGGLLGGMF
ncbi:hypothetical protein OPQ81_003231 [Rhizoctonia solani]|nr:hypothetical protein OPQ81_003231 [Rhizoctonia solani]